MQHDMPSASHPTMTYHRSLQRQVSLWTVLVLLILAIVAGGYAFWQGYREVSDFQQDNLKNLASLFTDAQHRSTHQQNYRHFLTKDSEGGMSVDIFALPLRPQQDLPDTMVAFEQLSHIPKGFSEQNIDNKLWQVYRQDNKDDIIIVRQRSDLQDDIAKDGALQSGTPLLFAMVTLAILLPLLIWWMLRPIRQVANQIDERQNTDLSPLPLDNLPTEILPLVYSINQLFGQVQLNIQAQQQFIADASHELRSPLTAISLQVQRLQRLPADEKIQTGLEKLAVRVKRNQDLVEQLLTLARLNATVQYAAAISLQPTIEQVINLLLPIADDKNISLQLQRLSPNPVFMDETALLLLVKNLLQNAILYTPPHGEVTVIATNFADWDTTLKQRSSGVLNATANLADLSVDDNTPILQIIDTGRGVNPADYEQMFEPFVRLATISNGQSQPRADTTSPTKEQLVDGHVGTGLGLSIVKSICQQADIQLYLSPSQGSQFNHSDRLGLCVTLVFMQYDNTEQNQYH